MNKVTNGIDDGNHQTTETDTTKGCGDTSYVRIAYRLGTTAIRLAWYKPERSYCTSSRNMSASGLSNNKVVSIGKL